MTYRLDCYGRRYVFDNFDIRCPHPTTIGRDPIVSPFDFVDGLQPGLSIVACIDRRLSWRLYGTLRRRWQSAVSSGAAA